MILSDPNEEFDCDEGPLETWHVEAVAFVSFVE